MRLMIFLVISILICPTVFSASGMKILTVEAGARSVGMGGAFTAVTADPYSAAFNPAATYGITELSGSFGHNTQWENVRIETGYISFYKKSVVFNFGLQFAEVSDIEARINPTADPDYYFNSPDISFKAGGAFKIYNDIIAGISFGWLHEKIDNESGNAFGADIGLLTSITPHLKTGISVINLGSKTKLREEEFELPTTYRGGFSYNYKDFMSSLDFVFLDDDFHTHIGGEYKIIEVLFLRAGYRTGYDTKTFSAGAGFIKRNFRIDYAFLPYKHELGDSHLINLTFSL